MAEPFNVCMGACIQTLRESKRYSQGMLGEQLNRAQGTISKWEAGEQVVDVEELQQLAALFGCEASLLLQVAQLTARVLPFLNTVLHEAVGAPVEVEPEPLAKATATAYLRAMRIIP